MEGQNSKSESVKKVQKEEISKQEFLNSKEELSELDLEAVVGGGEYTYTKQRSVKES